MLGVFLHIFKGGKTVLDEDVVRVGVLDQDVVWPAHLKVLVQPLDDRRRAQLSAEAAHLEELADLLILDFLSFPLWSAFPSITRCCVLFVINSFQASAIGTVFFAGLHEQTQRRPRRAET